MRNICIVVAIFLMAASAAMAGDSFGPWDADVAVGDDSVEGMPAAGHGRCRADAEPVTDRGVYNAFAGGAVLLIRVFQIWISPLDGPSCRFRPVCSAYGREAVRKYGAFLGGVLAGDRILRCNIFSTPGDDPVPDSIPVK